MVFRKPRRAQESYSDSEIALYLRDALVAAGKPASGVLRVTKLTRLREITVSLSDALYDLCESEVLSRSEMVYMLLAATMLIHQKQEEKEVE